MNPLIFFGLVSLGYYFLKETVMTQIVQESDDFNKYDDLFKQASRQTGVPWRYLKATAWVESDLGRDVSVRYGLENPGVDGKSMSNDGKSVGIMQTILATAQEVRPGTTLEELDDSPWVSILCGALIWKRNIKAFPGNLEYQVRAYNGGRGFLKTVAGQRDTPKYFTKWSDRLDRILTKNPGLALEIG